MVVALDYDGTYTLDPKAWDAVISILRAAGHEVVCITMRYEHEGAPGIPCPVMFTGRRAKVAWCQENIVAVDVWIDDSPQWIFRDAKAT